MAVERIGRSGAWRHLAAALAAFAVSAPAGADDEAFAIREIASDDRTVAAKHLSNLSAGGGRGKVDDLHDSQCETVP